MSLCRELKSWVWPVSDTWQRLFSPKWDGPIGVVTVAEQKGSSPRNPGAKMVVSMSQARGTIGGGNLEHVAISEVRERLARFTHSSIEVVKLSLGKDLDQCCGGIVYLVVELIPPSELTWVEEVGNTLKNGFSVEIITDLVTGEKTITSIEDLTVTRLLPTSNASARLEGKGRDRVLIEQLTPYLMDVVLFGAGHVGKALVEALAPLDCTVRWIDSRSGLFPLSLPDNIIPCRAKDPVSEIKHSSPDTFFLVMTHSHSLDLRLVKAILDLTESQFVGLIGSSSKRKNFINKLRHSGMSDETLKRLICPIGLNSIRDKRPSSIALGTAAQLQIEFEQRAHALIQPESNDDNVLSM